ncbi:hypothetical protein ILP92_05450 [Maribius pontilimi]|uniref:Uncharacterized protein n=1 Tax=Palleronia pontilimi TaxID=1964209 RepID=A0A934ID03_9RHOB|nr:hypothetical protein [Palleronia pontilimi]MBJ3762187.1 hypothetical protein [Palleronia pontilimi]
MPSDGNSQDWLQDVIVCNDSPSYDTPGDVTVYRSAEDLCIAIEPWRVEGVGHILNGHGQRIRLMLRDEAVLAELDEGGTADPETLRSWLRHAARAVHAARVHRAEAKGGWFSARAGLGAREAEGVLPDTIEGLLAYIHLR